MLPINFNSFTAFRQPPQHSLATAHGQRPFNIESRQTVTSPYKFPFYGHWYQLTFALMLRRITVLFNKELLLEWRQQHTLYGILLYIAATIFVLNLSVSGLEAPVWNGLFWVIQLFVCVNAVAKSFLQESRGRLLYFYTIASPAEFILAKLLYNLLLMAVMSLLCLLLYSFFLSSPVQRGGLFVGIVVLGGTSISLVFTLLAAIAGRAQQNAALMAIMGFPIILPQLLLLMRLSKTAFGEVFKEGAVWQLCGMVLGLDVLIIALALILFPFLWKE